MYILFELVYCVIDHWNFYIFVPFSGYTNGILFYRLWVAWLYLVDSLSYQLKIKALTVIFFKYLPLTCTFNLINLNLDKDTIHFDVKYQ